MAMQVRQVKKAEKQLTIKEALGQAVLRKCRRLHAINCELAELGVAPVVTAQELLLLEQNGFLVDFDNLCAIDTVQ